MEETWQTKLASKELCVRFKRSMGAWHKMLPFFMAKKQVSLQGLDHWTYDVGVPRALTSISVAKEFYFSPWQTKNTLHMVRCPANIVTILDTAIDSMLQNSVQVGQNIFQVSLKRNSCRLLKNMGQSKFTVVAKASMKNVRDGGAYCNLNDEFIFATGGAHRASQSSVERYNIASDVWEEMPAMNQGRYRHSSCTLGSAVFVFCGAGFNKLGKPDKQCSYLSSIERLETTDMQSGWQPIPAPSTNFKPRWVPVVAALSPGEILIMGGYHSAKMLADAFIFNALTATLQQVVESTPFAFATDGTVSQQASPGVVVALVTTQDGSKLVEFKDGSIQQLE